MTADTITIQLRNQIRYDGTTHRRREVMVVPAQVAQHLIEAKKAKVLVNA
jgi:hypothetical protein